MTFEPRSSSTTPTLGDRAIAAPARGFIDRALLILLAGITVFVAVLATLPVPTPASGAAGAEAHPADRFAIVDALVFDGERFREHHDVWVEDGRIRAVGRRLKLPEALPRVDGRGHTLLPGLIDAHVHSYGSLLADSLRYGVTTVFDQFTAPANVRERRPLRESIGSDGQADLFSAGMLATAPGGHGTQFGTPVETLTAPEQAQAWVRARRDEGSDWIKIVIEDGSSYNSEISALDRATIAALVAAAHEAGLLAVAHVSRLADALMAVELGMDGLVHVWPDEVISEADAARLAEGGVFVIPTLAVISSVAGAPLTNVLADETGREGLSPMQRETLRGSFPTAYPEQLTVALANVERLAAAGVPLLAGTDAPNPGTAAGLSLHGELRLLARAGLAPETVLASATGVAVEAFGIDDRGVLTEGMLADLILVAGDLRESVEGSVALAGIWKDGVPVAREPVLEPGAGKVASAPAETLVSDFEDGIAPNFGTGWYESTDELRAGQSIASLSVVDGALQISGEIKPGFPFPWSGAMWFPGEQPMTPVDFSGRETLRFRARGDGRRYTVMVFGETMGNGIPPSDFFVAGEGWETFTFPLERFGTEGIISGISIVAQMPMGEFTLEIDDVVLE